MLPFAHVLGIYGTSEPKEGAAWATVLRAMPGWLWETDADFCLTYLSEGLEQHSSLNRSDLLGHRILETGAATLPTEAGLAAYQAKLRAHAPVEQMIYERIMVSGQRAVFLDSALPKFDRKGKFMGYRGMTFHLSQALENADQKLGVVADLKVRADMLESMLAQRNKDLEHSNNVMSEILNAMGEGLLVTTGDDLRDFKNRILFVNPAFLDLFGFSADEIYPGRPVREVFDRLVARDEIDAQESTTIGALLARPAGNKLHLKQVKRTVYISGARRPDGGYVLLHTDMTEVEARNVMLEKARQAADVANQAKSNFLASMSHEIRTPMNGIVGMTDLLALTELTEDQRDCVDTIRASGLALTTLISDILDFSKVEAGKMDVTHAPMSLRDTCRDVVALMKPMAEDKGLTMTFGFDPLTPTYVIGDQARLRQVLFNLLGNAIKFTLSGSVNLDVSGSDPVVLSVEDTGIGIPEDKLERVFHAFEQAHGGLQRQFEGTGLGLAISRKLVEAMGGTMRVTSTEGVGTTFDIEVALVSCDKPMSEAHEGRGAATLSEAHLLVAEDNRTNQIVVERMLKRLGVACTLVENGRDAVSAFEQGAFDGILMDLSMPKLNGLDASRLIRQIEQESGRAAIPIIALTGNAFEQDKEDARNAGMNGFLSKPLQLATLREELAQHFSHEAGEGAARAS